MEENISEIKEDLHLEIQSSEDSLYASKKSHHHSRYQHHHHQCHRPMATRLGQLLHLKYTGIMQ